MSPPGLLQTPATEYAPDHFTREFRAANGAWLFPPGFAPKLANFGDKAPVCNPLQHRARGGFDSNALCLAGAMPNDTRRAHITMGAGSAAAAD